MSFVCCHIAAQTDGDEDDRDETFEDEGPSRVIALGREFQRRVWSEGRWGWLPRRLNLRPLADLRAVRPGIRMAVDIDRMCIDLDIMYLVDTY